MAILQAASVQDRKRLLELFPLAVFREVRHDLKGTKDEVCYSVAEQSTPDQIVAFIRAHIGRCKQHVYIFNRNPNERAQLPEAVSGGEKAFSDQEGTGEAIYIIRTSYSVVLKDPLEETELEFLWPIKVQIKPNHLIVRFVALEKDVSSYFERQCYVVRRSIQEKTVLQDLGLTNAERTDIHKGIKALWDAGFMDSPRTKFKKPKSMASEAMDEELGIKEHNPELYETLLDSVLLQTLFVTKKELECGVSAFSADCANGLLAFPRYSDAERNTDFVIDEILRHNQ
jgi:hypothetical protein